MHDFGLAVSPLFKDGPLTKVSDRALKVWLVLASRAAHVRWTFDVDGLRVPLEPGQLVISMRRLQHATGGGMSRLIAALDELEAIDAIETAVLTETGKASPLPLTTRFADPPSGARRK